MSLGLLVATEIVLTAGIGILYYGEILGKGIKWEEIIMLNLKILPPF
jgi:hypothetical protein